MPKLQITSYAKIVKEPLFFNLNMSKNYIPTTVFVSFKLLRQQYSRMKRVKSGMK